MSIETSTVKIMVVDDDEAMHVVLRRLLESDSVTVLTAPSAAIALQMMSRVEVDVLVADMVMVGMDGISLLEHVMNTWPHTTRILLTGHSWSDSLIDAVNRAAVSKIITKPLDHTRTRMMLDEVVTACMAQRVDRSYGERGLH